MNLFTQLPGRATDHSLCFSQHVRARDNGHLDSNFSVAGCSLPRDDVVLHVGDEASLVPVEARLVGERERGVGAFAERQRKLVVSLELLVDLASLRGLDSTVLGGQPGALDFGRLLRVASHQDLASQARSALHTLLLPLTGLRHTGLVQQVLAEFLLDLVGGERLAGAEENAVRRLSVNLVVVLRVHIDD